jgi:hypothetical protein
VKIEYMYIAELPAWQAPGGLPDQALARLNFEIFDLA